ncbi:MAG: ATP-binding protein [Planctomycetaceae bacterium]|nr:MAG: ATP-binding protein [Planctomycetaceae bacterium]
MKTVRDACELQPNALSIRLSDQIEQLDELIVVEGDGTAFFAKTHITQGMQDLISEGLARLAGLSPQAIYHLKQAMGGGKTHLLVAIGLLAKHPNLRKKYCGGTRYATAFETAAVAAFNGRNNPDHFFWGEIANQLGKGDQFRAFWTGGPKAPDEKDWLKLFEGDQPILILLDEMPPYFHYLDTQKVGNGTVADIATRAFANLLTAAAKKKNVCVVVSDLAASYDTGTKLINRALEDARAELGRQERNITPVDLAANEIYEILRKRLFTRIPDRAEIEDIAEAFGRKLEDAAKSKTASRGAEAIADEITATYPFHPRLKNVVALFKENEHFKQTRGLIELVSRLLKSAWERQANDVFLIGPQHFDLSIPEVRDKLTEISGMRDVIAKDLWDAQSSAHAQIIDLQTGQEAATQVGSLLLTASLSTAVNAVRGLTREEMVECLASPLREPSRSVCAVLVCSCKRRSSATMATEKTSCPSSPC